GTQVLIDAPFDREHGHAVVRCRGPFEILPKRYVRVSRHLFNPGVLRTAFDGKKPAAVVMILWNFRPAGDIQSGDELSIIGCPCYRIAKTVAAESHDRVVAASH